jgi:23S rRNA maturation-related 3'-5' exoribonuclease YhaM
MKKESAINDDAINDAEMKVILQERDGNCVPLEIVSIDSKLNEIGTHVLVVFAKRKDEK